MFGISLIDDFLVEWLSQFPGSWDPPSGDVSIGNFGPSFCFDHVGVEDVCGLEIVNGMEGDVANGFGGSDFDVARSGYSLASTGLLGHVDSLLSEVEDQQSTLDLTAATDSLNNVLFNDGLGSNYFDVGIGLDVNTNELPAISIDDAALALFGISACAMLPEELSQGNVGGISVALLDSLTSDGVGDQEGNLTPSSTENNSSTSQSTPRGQSRKTWACDICGRHYPSYKKLR